MGGSPKQTASTSSTKSEKSAGVVLRVDAAHQEHEPCISVPVEPPSREKALAAAGCPVTEVPSQIQEQATQLGESLQSRQRELDRRETALNRRAAELENELRKSHLWWTERQQDLQTRKQTVQEQEAKLEARRKKLVAAEASTREKLQKQHRNLSQREQRLQHEQQQLQKQREAVASREKANQLAERKMEQKLAADRTRLAERQRRIAETEQLLIAEAEQLKHDQQEVKAERDRLHELVQQWQQQHNQREVTVRAEFEQECGKLAQRATDLDRRQAALEQLHQEVNRVHGETLEMRLLTEQLWMRLVEQVPAADLTRSLGVLRSKLADHYRINENTASEKMSQLKTLAPKIKQAHEALAARQAELRSWLETQRRDLEQQAIELAERRELDEKARWQQWDEQQQWKSERRELQAKIRELTVALQNGPTGDSPLPRISLAAG